LLKALHYTTEPRDLDVTRPVAGGRRLARLAEVAGVIDDSQ